ncbi:hypothetical protein F0562_033618 [Nyssa sinensis]|uniref:Uncharacterized protein n=1 Tax=Nyssa sinensis TaxID=561372 RepID=A0A5J5AF57_9ASTE|nr:hypothetical protein F0562_033618 [Nyssa sinensis]
MIMMKNQLPVPEHVIGFPIISSASASNPVERLPKGLANQYHIPSIRQSLSPKFKESSRLESVIYRINKLGEKADNFANGILELRSIKASSPTGKLVKIHYKVLIPLRKIKKANESEM